MTISFVSVTSYFSLFFLGHDNPFQLWLVNTNWELFLVSGIQRLRHRDNQPYEILRKQIFRVGLNFGFPVKTNQVLTMQQQSCVRAYIRLDVAGVLGRAASNIRKPNLFRLKAMKLHLHVDIYVVRELPHSLRRMLW